MKVFSTSGFIISFNPLCLQISGSKFQSKSLRLWTAFHLFVPGRGNCNHWHCGPANTLVLDPHSSLAGSEEEGDARWKGKKEWIVTARHHTSCLFFTEVHQHATHRPAIRQVEDNLSLNSFPLLPPSILILPFLGV